MSWKYNRTPTYVKNNFAKLNVYFEALNYETVEQKKAYEGKTNKFLTCDCIYKIKFPAYWVILAVKWVFSSAPQL